MHPHEHQSHDDFSECLCDRSAEWHSHKLTQNVYGFNPRAMTSGSASIHRRWRRQWQRTNGQEERKRARNRTCHEIVLRKLDSVKESVSTVTKRAENALNSGLRFRSEIVTTHNNVFRRKMHGFDNTKSPMAFGSSFLERSINSSTLFRSWNTLSHSVELDTGTNFNLDSLPHILAAAIIVVPICDGLIKQIQLIIYRIAALEMFVCLFSWARLQFNLHCQSAQFHDWIVSANRDNWLIVCYYVMLCQLYNLSAICVRVDLCYGF